MDESTLKELQNACKALQRKLDMLTDVIVHLSERIIILEDINEIPSWKP